MSEEPHNLCNCPNCATNDCPAGKDESAILSRLNVCASEAFGPCPVLTADEAIDEIEAGIQWMRAEHSALEARLAGLAPNPPADAACVFPEVT
jgi:hypothetical protein